MAEKSGNGPFAQIIAKVRGRVMSLVPYDFEDDAGQRVVGTKAQILVQPMKEGEKVALVEVGYNLAKKEQADVARTLKLGAEVEVPVVVSGFGMKVKGA